VDNKELLKEIDKRFDTLDKIEKLSKRVADLEIARAKSDVTMSHIGRAFWGVIILVCVSVGSRLLTLIGMK